MTELIPNSVSQGEAVNEIQSLLFTKPERTEVRLNKETKLLQSRTTQKQEFVDVHEKAYKRQKLESHES